MKIKKFLLLIGFLSLILLVNNNFSSPVFAQESNPFSLPLAPSNINTSKLDLTISPSFINLNTDPGVPVSSKFEITNNTNLREYLKITLVKFKASKSGDKPTFEPLSSDDQFLKWVSFSENQFVILPNDQKTVRVTIYPPLDSGLGYYYAALIDRVENSNPNIDNQPSILILLEVASSEAKKELSFAGFKASSLFYEYLPARFDIQLKNKGNVHIIPSGDIFITSSNKINSWDKKSMATLPINQSRSNVLPDSTRTFSVFWDEAKKIRIGRFEAHLLAVYDNGEENIPIEAKISFWVIPWKIILGIVGGGIVAFLVLRILLRNLKKYKN